MARTKTLLETALAVKRKTRPVHPEEIEVALAWLNDALTISQVSAALDPARAGKGQYTGNVLYRVAVCLREARRIGKLQIAA